MRCYNVEHDGHRMEVEYDGTTVFWHRVRLIIDGRVADERAVFAGTCRLRTSEPMPVTVDATVSFFTGPRPPVLKKFGPMETAIAFSRV